MSTIESIESKPTSVTKPTAGDSAQQAKSRANVRKYIGTLLLHLALVTLSIILVLPFVWMVLTSLSPLDEVGVGSWVPSKLQWSNYVEVFSVIPFGKFYWNSLLIAAWVTFLQVFTSSLAAFSFSRINWPGRDRVFLLYLATMMLPSLVMMIPNYQIMISSGSTGTRA